MYLDKVSVKIVNITPTIKVLLSESSTSTIKVSIQDTSSAPIVTSIIKNETIKVEPKDYQVIIQSDAQPYIGQYTITPKIREVTTLATRGLLMRNDVKVEKVPYYEVSNENGITCIIGDE